MQHDFICPNPKRRHGPCAPQHDVSGQRYLCAGVLSRFLLVYGTGAHTVNTLWALLLILAGCAVGTLFALAIVQMAAKDDQ